MLNKMDRITGLVFSAPVMLVVWILEKTGLDEHIIRLADRECIGYHPTFRMTRKEAIAYRRAERKLLQ